MVNFAAFIYNYLCGKTPSQMIYNISKIKNNIHQKKKIDKDNNICTYTLFRLKKKEKKKSPLHVIQITIQCVYFALSLCCIKYNADTALSECSNCSQGSFMWVLTVTAAVD